MIFFLDKFNCHIYIIHKDPQYLIYDYEIH